MKSTAPSRKSNLTKTQRLTASNESIKSQKSVTSLGGGPSSKYRDEKSIRSQVQSQYFKSTDMSEEMIQRKKEVRRSI